MKNMRWGWVVLGGVLGEITTIVLITLLRLVSGQSLRGAFLATFIVGVFASLFLFAWWVARKAPARPVVHGLLVGVVAVLTYELMTIRVQVPVTWSYVVIHALKLVGGSAGGWVAAQRSHAQGALTTT